MELVLPIREAAVHVTADALEQFVRPSVRAVPLGLMRVAGFSDDQHQLNLSRRSGRPAEASRHTALRGAPAHRVATVLEAGAGREGRHEEERSKNAKAAAPRPEKGQPREGSKKQIVLDRLRRRDGATLAEIAKATGWQNHSIRGFISGTLTKKMDMPVASLKNGAGERVYRIEK